MSRPKKGSKNYIRYFRLAHKLRQYELAELLGVHPTTVSGWELGRNPQKRHIQAMMDLFHCTYEELFPYEDPNGYKMPERFVGDAGEAAGDGAETEVDETDGVEVEVEVPQVVDMGISLGGPWTLYEYRADADGDELVLRNAANTDPVPIDGIRHGGPWTVRLVPMPKAPMPDVWRRGGAAWPTP